MLTERPPRNTFTQRDKVFDLIFRSDPLLTKVDEDLRKQGRDVLADILVKLARDMGTEEQDDTFDNETKNFGDEAVADVTHSWEAEKPDIEDSSSEEILSGYEPVTEQRLSVLAEVAAALKQSGGDLSREYDAMMDEFKSMMAAAPAPQGPSSAPEFKA